MEVTKWLKPSVWLVTYQVTARVCGPQREQTPSKPRKGRCADRPDCKFRGRLIRLGEMSEDDAQPPHRGTGGSTNTRERAQLTGSPKAWSGQR